MAKKIGVVLAIDGEKEFRAAVTSANKSISAMKSELGLVTAQYEGQANTLEALSRKQEILGKILDEQRNKVQKTETALGKYEEKYKSVGKVVDKLKGSFQEQDSRLQGLQTQYAAAKDRLHKMTQEGNSSERSMQKQRGTIKSLEEAIKKQESTLDKSHATLARAQTGYDKLGDKVNTWKKNLTSAQAQAIKAEKTMNRYTAYMKEAAQSTDRCASSIDEFGKKAENAADVSLGVGDGFFAGIGAAFAEKGLDFALDKVKAAGEAVFDISAAMAQLQASTGMTEQAMEKYRDAMEEIRGDNFGDDYGDVADVMSQIIQIMGQIDPSGMVKASEAAMTLRDTFDMDINESLRAVDVMVKTMGVDADQAFDLLAKGAQRGLNRSGELADNITEYGQLWGQAGFSAEQTFAILENGLNSGAYNLDKVNDYVKEFTVSLADGRIEKNLSSFSEGTGKLFASWQSGGATASEVFYSVIDDLSRMENQQEALTVASEVWSALGEDNSLKVITALDDVNDAYGEVRGTMDQLKEVKYADLESSIAGLGAALQERFIAPLADVAIPALTGAVQAVTDLVDADVPQDQYQAYAQEVAKAGEALKDTAAESEKAVAAANEQADAVAGLGARLLELNSQPITGAARAEMRMLVESLSEYIPELAGAYDAVNGTFSVTDEQLQSMIGSTEKLTRAQAAQVESTKLQEQISAAEEQLRLAEDQKAYAEEQIRTAQEKGQSLEKLIRQYHAGKISAEEFREAAGMETIDAEPALQRYMDIVAEYGQKSGESAKQIRDLEAGLEEAREKQKEYAGTIEENTDVIDGYTEAVANNAEAEEAAAQTAQASAEIQKNALDSVRDSFAEVRQDIEQAAQDKVSIFDGFDGGDDVSLEKMQENLEKQKEGLTNYKKDMEILAGEIGSGISAEFYQYLSDLGPDAANAVGEIADALEKGTEEGRAEARALSDAYGENLDLSSGISDSLSAVRLAIREGLAGLSSEDAFAFDDLQAAAEAGFAGLEASARDNLNEVIAAAKNAGVSVPEGLTEGIRNGETTAQSAAAQLNAAIEGKFQGLEDVASQAGIKIPDGLKAGISKGGKAAADAVQGILSLLAGQMKTGGEKMVSDASDAAGGAAEAARKTGPQYQASGVYLGAQTAAGIAQAVPGVTVAARNAASGGAASARGQYAQYRQAGVYLTAGIAAGMANTAAVQAAARRVVKAGKDAAKKEAGIKSPSRVFRDEVGRFLPAGVAQGMLAGVKEVEQASKGMAKATLQASKEELEIHSPSAKFKNAVGKQIARGTAFGISAGKGEAVKASKSLAKDVYRSAVSWMDDYAAGHKASLEDEKYFWKQLAGTVKKGTKEYKKAVKEMNAIDNFESAVNSKVKKGFGVSKTTKSGKKTKKKSTSAYQADVVSAAQQWLDNYRVVHEVSLAEEEYYWQKVVKKLEKGSKKHTQAWYNAKKELKSVQDQQKKQQEDALAAKAEAESKRASVQANVQASLLNSYKVYRKVSEKAEAEYWDTARKQFKEGTQERIDADKQYFEAKQAYDEQLVKLTEEEAEKEKEIKDALIEKEKELRETYDDTVKSRKAEILSSMSLFESWDSEGYRSDRLTWNLKTQVEGLKVWEQQLKELGQKGLSEGLMEELRQMGPDAAANLYSLNEMTEEQLTEYNALWTEKNELAKRQAEEENKALWKETEDTITRAKKTADNEIAALKADYRSAVAELNEGLSDGLKGLVEQSAKIGEEIVSNLVNAIKDATSSSETKTALQKAQSVINSSANTAGTGASGGASSSGNASSGASGKKKEDKVVAIINTGKSRSKKLSKKEEKEHVELWKYLVKKYGKAPSNTVYKSLGKELGVKTDSTVTGSQKNSILKKLKLKGYSSGVMNLRQHELAWTQEKGPEVIVRGDGAVLTPLTTGSSVIPANLSKNLMEWGRVTPQAYLSSVARLNRLKSVEQPAPAVVTVDNHGILNVLERILAGMEQIAAQSGSGRIVLDTGALVGELQPALSRESAAAAVRRNRGRR